MTEKKKKKLFAEFRDSDKGMSCNYFMQKYSLTFFELMDLFGEYWHKNVANKPPANERRAKPVMIEETGEQFRTMADCMNRIGEYKPLHFRKCLAEHTPYFGYHVHLIQKEDE